MNTIEVTCIPLWKSDGTAYGEARVYQRDGGYGWSHPDGSEGWQENHTLAIGEVIGYHAQLSLRPAATVQIPTDPTYWGGTTPISDDRMDQICSNLERMISMAFSDRVNLTFERTQTIRGTGVHCEYEWFSNQIVEFINENWTHAL
jgi:hypothetical protein